ncbi:hypothetical protein D3C72_1652910 [compost metagenome]
MLCRAEAMASRSSMRISLTPGSSSQWGMVRAMPTRISVSSGASEGGHGSDDVASGGRGSFPVARSQRSAASVPSAAAASPSSAHCTSWKGG